MKTTAFIRCAVVALVCGLATSVQAASIFLSPSFTSAVQGDAVSISILGDFDDEPTLGGGFNISLDSDVFSFVSYTPSGIGDPAFQRDPDVLSGLLSGFAFGDFDGCPGPNCAPAGGVFLIGTIELEVLPTAPEGITFLFGSTSTDPVPGPFASAVTLSEQFVDYKGARISVKPIPLPAAVWLFAGGLGALLRFRT